MLITEKVHWVVDVCTNILKETLTQKLMIWPYFRLEVIQSVEHQKLPIITNDCEIELTTFEKKI